SAQPAPEPHRVRPEAARQCPADLASRPRRNRSAAAAGRGGDAARRVARPRRSSAGLIRRAPGDIAPLEPGAERCDSFLMTVVPTTRPGAVTRRRFLAGA